MGIRHSLGLFPQLFVLTTHIVWSVKSILNPKLLYIFQLFAGDVPSELGVFPYHPFICSHPSQSVDLRQGDNQSLLVNVKSFILGSEKQNKVFCSEPKAPERPDHGPGSNYHCPHFHHLPRLQICNQSG